MFLKKRVYWKKIRGIFLCVFDLKKEKKTLFSGGWGIFYRGDFSWDGVGTLPNNSCKPSQNLRVTKKENRIGSAVFEIIRFRHTDPVTLLKEYLNLKNDCYLG